jgi:hypothetical protein
MMIARPSDEVPHVYNDDLWYSFMGICIGTGCKATGIRAGAGLQVRCIDPPTGSFRDPSQEEPRAVSCESGFQDFPRCLPILCRDEGPTHHGGTQHLDRVG